MLLKIYEFELLFFDDTVLTEYIHVGVLLNNQVIYLPVLGL